MKLDFNLFDLLQMYSRTLTWKVEMIKENLNHTLHKGEGDSVWPPSNFEASELQQEGLDWSNLHMNLVTWVPTMTKTQKMFHNFNRVWATQVVTKSQNDQKKPV